MTIKLCPQVIGLTISRKFGYCDLNGLHFSLRAYRTFLILFLCNILDNRHSFSNKAINPRPISLKLHLRMMENLIFIPYKFSGNMKTLQVDKTLASIMIKNIRKNGENSPGSSRFSGQKFFSCLVGPQR